MKGADEFTRLFRENQQHGRLALVPGSHARGDTFRIFVLPDGEAAQWNGRNNAPLNHGAVEVYGVVDGIPGWTESYGWLHNGPWCVDFRALVCWRLLEIAEVARTDRIRRAAKNRAESTQRAGVLQSYQPGWRAG